MVSLGEEDVDAEVFGDAREAFGVGFELVAIVGEEVPGLHDSYVFVDRGAGESCCARDGVGGAVAAFDGLEDFGGRDTKDSEGGA